MKNKLQIRELSSFLAVALLSIIMRQPVYAQTLSVLYSFTNGADGGQPRAGVIRDSAGNFYGTTWGGGLHQSGTIYKLTPGTGGWTEFVLYSFGATPSDGVNPRAGLVRDGSGNLYGTTMGGGSASKGAVFKLSPAVGGGWTETILHSFTGGTDGAYPSFGSLILAGSYLYGTTVLGGDVSCINAGMGCGVAFREKTAGGQPAVLHRFSYSPPAGNDGAYPYGGLARDSLGNLYGVTNGGGSSGAGVVFELAPASGGVWNETFLHVFSDMQADGANSFAGLVRDRAGNLYGNTSGTNNMPGINGLVFKLDSGLNETFPHRFTGPPGDGASPTFNLIVDAKGNLYGTTPSGGEFGAGTIFEVSPVAGGWSEKLLYSFTGGADGSIPQGTLFRDSAGNLYGATIGGGTSGAGVVFKFHP